MIITRRFLLRDFTEHDRLPFLTYHADPGSLALYGPDETAPGHAEALLQTFALWASEQPRRNYQLAVVRRQKSEALVGCCGLRRAGFGEHRAELGIELAPGYWGRHGLAIEIARAMIDFGFADLGLQEIFGRSNSANTRIKRLATWFGATEMIGGPAPTWMEERGWHETEWRITREGWKRKAGVRGQ